MRRRSMTAPDKLAQPLLDTSLRLHALRDSDRLYECLISEAAHLSGARRVLPSIGGRPPDLLHAPPGCRFHDRCPEAAPVCRQVMPREHLLAPGHSVSCLRRGSPGEEAP